MDARSRIEPFDIKMADLQARRCIPRPQAEGVARAQIDHRPLGKRNDIAVRCGAPAVAVPDRREHEIAAVCEKNAVALKHLRMAEEYERRAQQLAEPDAVFEAGMLPSACPRPSLRIDFLCRSV